MSEVESQSPPVRATRHEVSFDARLESVEQGQAEVKVVSAEIVDLSIGGIAVRVAQSLPVASTWVVRLDPLLCSAFQETAVVRWCRQDDDGQWRCGFQFVSALELFVQSGIGLQQAVTDLGDKALPSGAAATAATTSSPTSPGGGAIAFGQHAVAQGLSHINCLADQGLNVTGDVLDCQLVSSGPLVVTGQLAGGTTEIRHTFWAKELGHADGRATTVVIGGLPSDYAVLDQVPKRMASYAQLLEAYQAELDEKQALGDDADHATRERIMELEFQVIETQDKQAQLQQKYDKLLEHYRTNHPVKITVETEIHAGVKIVYNGQESNIRST